MADERIASLERTNRILLGAVAVLALATGWLALRKTEAAPPAAPKPAAEFRAPRPVAASLDAARTAAAQPVPETEASIRMTKPNDQYVDISLQAYPGVEMRSGDSKLEARILEKVPSLALKRREKDGFHTVTVALDDAGARVHFRNGVAEGSVRLTAGEMILALGQNQHSARLSLTLDETGRPHLTLTDGKGATIWTTP